MPQFERITLIIESLPGARAQVQVNIPTPTPGMRLETPAHALAIDALGWLGKQPAVAGFVYGGTPEALEQANYLRKWFGPDTEKAARLLEIQHARIQELEQGKCLHQIGEPQKFTIDSKMSRAFEIEYGQDWTDPDWRREAGAWASAWHKATNAALAAQAKQGGAA